MPTGRDVVEKTLENALFSALVPQGAIQAGPFVFNPLGTILQAGYNLYRGLSDRQKAESQKRDNLFYLTLDEMRKAGEDPYEQYPEDLFDVSQYPEFAGIAPSGSPEEMRRETISAAVYNWRERNQDIVQQAYDAFLRSGLDYDEYKKRLEEGEPVVEEEVSLEPDPDLTPQQTFEGLEEEQKIGRINDALEKNPNASLADILDILTSWNIPTDLFRKATGTTPEEYVAQRDAPPSTEPPFEKPGQGEEQGEDDGQLGDDTSETEVIDDDSRKIDDGDGECQPGYERWNGSCVAVCNAAAGYVRDEDPSSPSYGSCVLMGDGGGEGEGDNGGGDDDTKDNGKTCATGYVYDEALQKCVPIKEEETGDGGDLNAPTETTVTGLPQQPTTETGGVGGMFAFAAPSPNRTTSEVLAPDLFKIDANIPLIGRLTQASPMAAPQYLLSGISQRYKV